MTRRAGFTIVELIITLTIMVILMTLATVSLLSTLANGRDEERKTDVANIMVYLNSAYLRNNGSYFTTSSALVGSVPGPSATVEAWYGNFDRSNLRAPGVVPPNYSIVAATNAIQTAAGVLPQPTTTTYVYQPLDNAGALCTTSGNCRKFNIYYLEETTGSVKMLMSKNQ